MSQITPSSMSQKSRLLWFAILCVVLVGLDQWSKVYAVQNWKGMPSQSFFNDLFRIEYAENHGAFLSLFSNLPDTARFWILTVFNGAVLVGVSVYLLFSKTVTRWVFFAFTLVVAGGIGNMIDRARFGYVIDYYNLGWGELRTGIFNVADMAITAGFFMMVPLIFTGDPKPEPQAEKTSDHHPKSAEIPASEGSGSKSSNTKEVNSQGANSL